MLPSRLGLARPGQGGNHSANLRDPNPLMPMCGKNLKTVCFLLWLLVSVLLLTLYAPESAQSQPQENSSTVTTTVPKRPSVPHLLPEMTVTATREERSLLEVPQAVTTI